MKTSLARRRSWEWMLVPGVAILLVLPVCNAAESTTESVGVTLPPGFTERAMMIHLVDAQSSQPVVGAKVINSSAFLTGRSAESEAPGPRTDAQGNAQIQVIIPPAEIRAQLNDFTVSIEHTNYSPRVAQWHSDGSAVIDDVPAEYTFRLQKGILLGGVVKDDKGQPLPNTQILINGYGGSGYNVGTGEKKVQEYSVFNTPLFDPETKAGIRTDAEGRWTATNFPPDVQTVSLVAIRNDGSDATYVTSQERFGNSPRTKLVSLGELRARSAVFVLPSGFTVRGRVLNLEGKPVPGAKVIEAFGMGNPQPRGRAITDGQGRFEFANRRARQCIWTVDAPGYALKCEVVTLRPDAPEVAVTLQPAKPAVLRLTLDNGKPAAGAKLQTVDYRNEAMYLNFSAKADADGLLIWTNAPPQEVRAWVSAPGKTVRLVTLQGGREDRVVLSEKPIEEVKVSVQARSAKDHRPLDSFEVQLDLAQMRRFVPWAQGTNGLAEGVVRGSDFRSGMYRQFVLRVSAKGFSSKDLESVDFNEGDRQLEVLLNPDAPLKGVVKLPDGTPAAGAFVVVNREPGPLFLNQQFQRGPVKPPSWGNLNKVECGEDGAYDLQGVIPDAVVIAMHESGYAKIPRTQLQTNSTITLRPWERLEGVLKIGDQPAKAGLRVGLSTITQGPGFGVHFDATTDDQGQFVFERIPAGAYQVYRHFNTRPGTIVYSHREEVEVLPGKLAQVQLGGRGVRVVGRVKPSRYADLDWTLNKQILTAKSSAASPAQSGAVAWEDFVLRADYQAAANKSGVGQSASPKQYLLTFDKDGTFFVDDVEPGEYALDVKVAEPPPSSRQWEEGKLIAAMSTNLVIAPPPPGQPATVQVGPFILPVPTASSGDVVPPLHVQLLDGRPLELGGKKAKAQVILFWAPWSDQSLKALGALGKSAATASSSMTTVAVAVEEDQAEIKKAVGAAAWRGTVARLTGSELVKAFTNYGLTELPLILVVDNQGQLALKTNNPDRVRDALAEVSVDASPTAKRKL